MEQNYKELYYQSLEQIKDLEQRVRQLSKEASIDKLTGMGNRRIMNTINNIYSTYVVALGDVDHFKFINDQYGHIVGDRVLIEIGNILNSSIRETDFVIRWGGDEILLLLENCFIEEAYEKLNQIKNIIQEKIYYLYHISVTMSFGLTVCNQTESLDVAINNADNALYESKNNGKNMVTVYNDNIKKNRI